MTLRYCPRCRADVEDAGGFCLLGHRLPIEDPIADLRTEVDRAFQKVQDDISNVFEKHSEEIQEPVLAPAGIYEQLKSEDEIVDEVLSNRRDVWRELSKDAPVERDDPILSFSPSPRMEWGDRARRRRRRED